MQKEKYIHQCNHVDTLDVRSSSEHYVLFSSNSKGFSFKISPSCCHRHQSHSHCHVILFTFSLNFHFHLGCCKKCSHYLILLHCEWIVTKLCSTLFLTFFKPNIQRILFLNILNFLKIFALVLIKEKRLKNRTVWPLKTSTIIKYSI